MTWATLKLDQRRALVQRAAADTEMQPGLSAKNTRLSAKGVAHPIYINPTATMTKA